MGGWRRRAALHIALLCLALAFAIQLGGRVVGWLYAHPGDPPLAEVVRALPPDSPVLLEVDLRAAPRAPRHPATRRIPMPAAWGAQQPFLLVFVDGQRVAFSRTRPVDDESGSPRAFYVPVSHREVGLAVICSGGPCRSVVAVVEGPTLRLAIARVRAPRRPVAVGVAAVLLGVWIALLVAARRSWTARAWLGAAAATVLIVAAWLLYDVASKPRFADPVLVYELVFTGLAVCAGRWGLERWGPVLAGTAAGTLLVPLVLTDHTYLTDWANHLYYAARQADSIRELLRPSYFLHSDVTGAFYPYFAFYGGTAYAVTGLVGAATGSITFAYRSSYAAGLLAAYAGTTWLARQAGLASWRAHLPGLVLVSSAYYLTNPYGRGTWGEFLATSAIPPLIAASVSLLRAGRRRGSALALFASAVAFSGCHTITLVWGSLFLALVAALGLATGSSARRAIGLRPARLVDVVLLIASGIAANAWFLAPLMAFGRATDIARHSAAAFGTHAPGLADPGVWLHPGRYIPASGAPGLYVQLSVYALVWAAAACAARFRQLSTPRRRLCLGLWALLALFLWLITSDRLDAVWAWAPAVLKAVQFQFRLHSYVALLTAGLVLIGLVAVAGSPRAGRWQAALVCAVAVQLALAQYQIWGARRYMPIADVVAAGPNAPRSLQAPYDYRFTGPAREGERILEAERHLHIDASAVRGERAVIAIADDSPAGLAVLDVPHSPFLQITGDGHIVGRTRDGWTVVALDAPRAARPRRLEAVGALPWAARAGVTLSLAALGLGAFLVRRG